MEFDRKRVDKDIDAVLTAARKGKCSSEGMLLIDTTLREYVVAVEQMVHYNAKTDDICDASTTLVCSMITNLAKLMNVKDNTEFIGFFNKFMFETTRVMEYSINQTYKELGVDSEAEIKIHDPRNLNH